AEKKKETGENNDSEAATPLVTRPEPMFFGAGDEFDSPPLSRKSRDARSITTADSSLNDFGSRNSLDRSISFTPSETMVPSSQASSSNKESFMAKLTRKS